MAVGAGAGVDTGAVVFGANSHQRNARTTAPMTHGHHRAMPVRPAATAASPAAIAALPAVAAPPAIADPARRAVSVAAVPRPASPLRNEAGLAKPSALVMRLSSAPWRLGPWLPSSDASEFALRPF